MMPSGVISTTLFATVDTHLMVMGGKEQHFGKSHHRVVQRCDGLKVEMVGGFIENQGVGIGKHHFREHAAHPFAAREDGCFFHGLFSGKKHFAQEPPDKSLVFLGRCKLVQASR